ncbi:MAG: hypothetical protein GTN36_00195 [Candidatus Aenigmarchaeota archaeon]|nr:hypothetical protein [Candidatus Aenigmarchaeota archaeon]
MFKRVGNCIICGEKTQRFCDGCEVFICETHSFKPFADKEIILCRSCWKNKNEILNKIKDSASSKINFFDISRDHPF